MIECPKVEAIAAVTRSAWVTGDGRRVVHCIASGWIGTDWDERDVIGAVTSARSVTWDPWAGHDLRVVTLGGLTRQFQATR